MPGAMANMPGAPMAPLAAAAAAAACMAMVCCCHAAAAAMEAAAAFGRPITMPGPAMPMGCVMAGDMPPCDCWPLMACCAATWANTEEGPAPAATAAAAAAACGSSMAASAAALCPLEPLLFCRPCARFR